MAQRTKTVFPRQARGISGYRCFLGSSNTCKRPCVHTRNINTSGSTCRRWPLYTSTRRIKINYNLFPGSPGPLFCYQLSRNLPVLITASLTLHLSNWQQKYLDKLMSPDIFKPTWAVLLRPISWPWNKTWVAIRTFPQFHLYMWTVAYTNQRPVTVCVRCNASQICKHKVEGVWQY